MKDALIRLIDALITLKDAHIARKMLLAIQIFNPFLFYDINC